MTTQTITVNASDRAALAAAKVEAARLALAMAEAELRVWQQVEREAKLAAPARRQTLRTGNDHMAVSVEAAVLSPAPTMTSSHTKRDRRPGDRWMGVLRLLAAKPVSQADLTIAVAPFGIDKRTLSDQVRRYLGPLGLLVEDGGMLALTARAKQFLAAYEEESDL